MSDIAWQCLAASVTTLFGFEAVRRSVMHIITNKTVTVEEYRKGKAELHNECNELKIRVAVLEDREARK